MSQPLLYFLAPLKDSLEAVVLRFRFSSSLEQIERALSHPSHRIIYKWVQKCPQTTKIFIFIAIVASFILLTHTEEISRKYSFALEDIEKAESKATQAPLYISIFFPPHSVYSRINFSGRIFIVHRGVYFA